MGTKWVHALDDLIQDPENSIETDPPELEGVFVAAMTSSLAKDLANNLGRPWTSEQASKMQADVAALVAAAQGLGLATFRVVVIRSNGHQVTRELVVERINKTRSLQ